MTTKNYVGKTLTIQAGARVSRLGSTTKRTVSTKVRVRAQQTTRKGKVRVFWKSNGYTASTVI